MTDPIIAEGGGGDGKKQTKNSSFQTNNVTVSTLSQFSVLFVKGTGPHRFGEKTLFCMNFGYFNQS